MAGCQINGGMMNSDLNMGFGSPVMADPAQSSGYGNRVPYPVPQIAVPTPTIAARRNRPHLATLRSGNMRSHSSVGKMSSPAGSNAQNPVDCSIVRRSHSANASRLAHNRIRSTHPYWQQAPSPLHYTTFAEVGDSHQEDAYQQEPDGSSPCYQLSRPKPGFLEQVPLTPLSPIDRQSVPYPTAFKRLASGRSSFGQSSQASTPAKLPVLPLNTQFSFVSPPMTPGSQSLYSANSHSGYDLSSAGPIDFSSYLNYRDPLQDSLASLHDSVGSSALHDQGILYFDHVPNPTTENRPNVAQPRSVDEFGLGRTNPISPQLSVPESRAAIAGFLEFELPRRTGQSEPQFLSQASTVRQQQPQAAQHQRHLSRQSVENCQLGPMENAFFDLEPWTYNFDTTVDHRTDFLAPIV